MEVTTKDPGTPLRAPTSEAGFTPACKDTCFGDLRLRLWERRYDGTEGKVLILGPFFNLNSPYFDSFPIFLITCLYGHRCTTRMLH